MSKMMDGEEGAQHLLMGNEAITRGILEAGVSVASGYPGTPSTEIIENLSREAAARNLYVEWSTNEKVAMEVAAAGSLANLRSLCVMKQNGVNVASDFMLHLVYSGTRGGMVLVTCDDPGGLSSANEGESRHFARMLEIPLLEPGDLQEAKDIIPWAYDLSEALRTLVVVRSVTRISHASGMVRLGKLPAVEPKADFKWEDIARDPCSGPVLSMPPVPKHAVHQEKMKQVYGHFEKSPFNTYRGPEKPELLIITSSVCYQYSKEAISLLGVQDRVGLLKLGTTWPLPPELLNRYFHSTDRILVVEEVIPFLEDHIKALACDQAPEVEGKTIHGKVDGTIPMAGELNPDLIAAGLGKILGIPYQALTPEYSAKMKALTADMVPVREAGFCPGCPHRASYWSIHQALKLDGRRGFVCGDIGCYAMARRSCGYFTIKTLHSMGSGTGVASGFGKLGQFGMDQPVLAVCGDSTFFHAAMPALVNAVHNRSNITLVVMNNSGTAMTGFQPHPGLKVNAVGEEVPSVDIAALCRAMGAKVEVRDPFDIEDTRKTVSRMIEDREGVKVLVLEQLCALSPEKRRTKAYKMSVDEKICLGEQCGCNRLCTRVFRCSGLFWDRNKKKAGIDDVICAGCGVCSFVCPAGAIKKEVA